MDQYCTFDISKNTCYFLYVTFNPFVVYIVGPGKGNKEEVHTCNQGIHIACVIEANKYFEGRKLPAEVE